MTKADYPEKSYRPLIEIHRMELLELWQDSVEIFSVVEPLIKCHASDIISGFYRRLLAQPQAAEFLDSELIHQRLKQGVTAWLSFTFCGAHAQTIDQFLEYQARLGRIHADMDIPLNLFLLGLRMLKAEMIQSVSCLDRTHQQAAILYITQLLDLVLAIASESYNLEHGELMSDLQRMRMSIPPENLQLVCEQMRSRLLMWFTEQLTSLHRGLGGGSEEPVGLGDSEIGMWLEHKAPLLFPENHTLEKLHQACVQIDAQLVQARRMGREQDATGYQNATSLLDEQVKKADWLLGELGREVSEMEGRTDPLTQLFNRRHLNTVMNFESRKARLSHQDYGVILLDIDHFKLINDRYGHDAGDTVLRCFSQRLVESVRGSDFVFRYGGEEFLILLPSVRHSTLIRVAEALREKIAAKPFPLPDGSLMDVTVSCGVALSGGELNYERTIKRADQGLYEAKQAGRNCCVMAPQ